MTLRAASAGFRDCTDDILRLTGGIPWLVNECLTAHDETDCRDDPAHRALQHAIRPRILHRLASATPPVRRLVVELSLGRWPMDAASRSADASAVLAEAYAEGLLSSEGRPAPAIAAAARAMTPATELVDLIPTVSRTALHGEHLVDGLDGILDARAADALVTRARREASGDPELAGELLDHAIACGADPAAVSLDRARLAWSSGRLDDAGVLLDGVVAGSPASVAGPVLDLAAAVWAERGMMTLADETYRAQAPDDAAAAARVRIAALAVGRPIVVSGAARALPGDVPKPPSALGVGNELLNRGLTAALENDSHAAVAALQRASELYTASADDSPAVELPAVIAAAATIGVGDLKTAQAIVDDALCGAQGGAHRRARLELWASWVALQRERPVEARAALARATSGPALTPRDEAMAAAITIGLARRYEDVAELAAQWESALPRFARCEPDLFRLLPLSELAIAAARLGDPVTMQPEFERALQIVADLGDPPIWAAPLHWAGIQRGILLNQPEALAPHARALVAAAPHNRLAAHMAHAGKVWTAVLSGTVDADAVERAARGLATVGLAWDGARLAGHGAGRTEDRRVIARLLACARELHPRDSVRPVGQIPDASAPASGDGSLSDREREVAELVLQGKTYAEIGAAIFISPRTAEHHIAHIRRRLNATSRSDLLSKLRIALERSTSPAPAAGGGGSSG